MISMELGAQAHSETRCVKCARAVGFQSMTKQHAPMSTEHVTNETHTPVDAACRQIARAQCAVCACVHAIDNVLTGMTF